MKKEVILFVPFEQPSKETNEYLESLNKYGFTVESIMAARYVDIRLDGMTYIAISGDIKKLLQFKKEQNVLVIRKNGKEVWLPMESKEERKKCKNFLFKGVEA